MTKQHQYFLFSHLTLTIVPAPAGREVWGAVNDDDDYGSRFFLSYARTTEGSAGGGEVLDPDGYVEKFFHDLADNVGQLIYPRADVPAGFMDQDMPGGMQWPDQLLRAVGTCQVLVALLSARYLRSGWCRMEWHAFSQRAMPGVSGADAPPRQGCIIPVIWAPFHSTLPDHIKPVTIFSPTRDPEPSAPVYYQRNGVLGLMRMRRLRACYEIVTWQLALHIAHIYHSQRTEHRKFDVAELRKVLRDDGHGG